MYLFRILSLYIFGETSQESGGGLKNWSASLVWHHQKEIAPPFVLHLAYAVTYPPIRVESVQCIMTSQSVGPFTLKVVFLPRKLSYMYKYAHI